MTTEANKPNPRRRWLQYSLRAFFVLVTVFSVWLGVVVHRANEQKKAVEWVREIGGSVWYDYQYDADGSFINDAEPPGPKWLMQLLGAEYFQEVFTVDLFDKQVSDLTPLVELKQLKDLGLYNTSASDLAPLAKLPNLRWLWLNGTQVSDLTPLAKLTSLERLELNDTPVNDLRPLAKLTRLEYVSCRRSPVSDLAPLRNLTNLDRLELNDTPVCDLTPLTELKSLGMLDLTNTPVNKERIEELRRALPNCLIFWSPPSSDPSP